MDKTKEISVALEGEFAFERLKSIATGIKLVNIFFFINNI